MIEHNEPAFPRDHAHDGHNGLTKREYFAAKAMQGILASQIIQKASFEFTGTSELISKLSVAMADVLINELNK